MPSAGEPQAAWFIDWVTVRNARGRSRERVLPKPGGEAHNLECHAIKELLPYLPRLVNHAPQALNRYSYCLNNPLRYTDPTGHAPLEDPEEYAGSGQAQPLEAETVVPESVMQPGMGDVRASEGAWEDPYSDRPAIGQPADPLAGPSMYNMGPATACASGGSGNEAVSYLTSPGNIASRAVDLAAETGPRLTDTLRPVVVNESRLVGAVTESTAVVGVVQSEVIDHGAVMARQTARSVAGAAPFVGGAIQFVSDTMTDPTMAVEDRVVRAGIAVGAGLVAAGVTAVLVPAGAGAATAVGLGLAVSFGADYVKDRVIYPLFDWRKSP